MPKLIIQEYLTLDGIAESPEKWQFPYYSEDVAEFNAAYILDTDYLLLGRGTYDVFSAFWPLQKNNEFGIADKLNAMPKFVVSSTLREATWANTTVIKDPIQEVGELKRKPGSRIAVPGSLTLARLLMAHNLVDEIHLLVHPIVLGGDSRLFDGGNHTMSMNLLASRAFSSGVVSLVYAPEKERAE